MREDGSMFSVKNAFYLSAVLLLAGCTTSLKDLDDMSLINTKEVRAQQRVEEAEIKAEIAEKVSEAKAEQQKIEAEAEMEEVPQINPQIIE